MNREQARHYHPSNYFNRQLDAISTVEDFNRTVLDAQAVVEAGKLRDSERLAPAILFSASRARRAKRMDAIAVTLLLMLMAAMGALVMLASAPSAKAEPSDAAVEYAQGNGRIACNVLSEYPSINGLIGVMQGIVEHGGWSYYEAGQITAMSVYAYCPQHLDLLDRFVALYGEQEVA
jgi:hypothetical protein